MLEYRFNLDVHIFDTDCFGVMWHGAYTKWLEMGRVNLFKSIGVAMSLPGEAEGYIYPVAEQNLRFRAPARMGDVLTLVTRLEVSGHKLLFHQRFQNLATDQVTLEAVTTVVVVDGAWKLQRKLPPALLEKIGPSL